MTQMSHCKIHLITTSAHTIKEYETLDGQIFAVTWRGISRPRLAQIFGNYYQEYAKTEAATPVPRGRAPFKLTSSNLIVEHGGHARDVRGRAVMPALVPNGVDLSEIQ
jgi:hypothetical protein